MHLGLALSSQVDGACFTAPLEYTAASFTAAPLKLATVGGLLLRLCPLVTSGGLELTRSLSDHICSSAGIQRCFTPRRTAEAPAAAREA